ncbi:MAG: hypothetical protein JNK45_33540 [Myxococcales bacterium]|nr:hypothetical protein [Myxococcales bacterium]
MSRTLAALALCLTAAATLPASTAQAHGPGGGAHRRPVAAVAAPTVRVMIEAPEGGAFASVEHRGAMFVAGELGERYAVRLVNDSADRLEVVVSVDGRDVLSGKVGDFKRQRGYVIDPFGEVVIDGFRRSLDHVAAFRFSSVRDSYSARRGTPQHVGVIGVAVFREKAASGWAATRPRAAADARDESSAAPRSKSPRMNKDVGGARGEKLGTEFGESLVSEVIEVPFVRRNQTRPDELHRVVYDSAERLRARGVPIDPVFVHEPWDRGDPSPWPGAVEDRQFAPPPPPRRTWR